MIEYGVGDPHVKIVVPCPHWTDEDAEQARKAGLDVRQREVGPWEKKPAPVEEGALHVRRADGMDLCEYDDEDWPCAYERARRAEQ